MREGFAKDWIHHQLPLIPGWDFSGTIDRLGPGVTGFKVGDDVYTRADVSRNGAYAEYLIVKASELAHKPRSIDHVHAAAVPLAALTAWQAIFDLGGLEPGQTILIHGAAGGVGHFAVQLAKWKGARVIATGSGRSERLLRELGADEFIDYTKRKFEDVVRDVDVVLDVVGGDTTTRSLHVLKKGGILVSTIASPPEEEVRKLGVRAVTVSTQTNVGQLEEIARLIDGGSVKPDVEQILPLPEARKAQEISQSGHAHGKIVLEVGA